MSVYTYVKKEVVDVLERDHFGGTYVLRMEPIYAEVTEEEWYDAMNRGEPIDQVYIAGEEQKRYWIWGPDITRGIVFEVQEDGTLFTANRGDAIQFAEFLMMQYDDVFYKEHVSHDNDCYWDPRRQQWVGIALDSGAMYTPVEWIGSDADPTYPSFDSHPDDGTDIGFTDDVLMDDDYYNEPDVIQYLDSIACNDGSWDVVRLLSDGTTDMIKLYYDPFYVDHDAHVQLWDSLFNPIIPF